MNVKEFQEKLNEVCAAAEQTNGVVTGARMREFFTGMELDKQQLIQILQYLKAKGITIEGMEAVADADAATDAESEEIVEKELVPLTAEEEAYLKNYLAELEETKKEIQRELKKLNGEVEMSWEADCLEKLFQVWKEKKAGAKEVMTQYYMPIAAEIAVELNCEEVYLADLIQEANVSLLMALSEAEMGLDGEFSDKWIRRKIREGVTAIVEEQTQRSMGDNILVEKVQKLDQAIRDLSEDEEDGESPFTIGELAVILDMKVDEIKDILRLAGEDEQE